MGAELYKRPVTNEINPVVSVSPQRCCESPHVRGDAPYVSASATRLSPKPQQLTNKQCAKRAASCAELTCTASATEDDDQEIKFLPREDSARGKIKKNPKQTKNSEIRNVKMKKIQIFSVFAVCYGAEFVLLKRHIQILWCTLKMTDHVTDFRKYSILILKMHNI